MPPKVTTFEHIFQPGARLRTWFERDAGAVVHFTVTLEVEVSPDDWRAVARYDTTGGTVHRDRLKPDGEYLTHRETVNLGEPHDQAMKNAQKHLVDRASFYLAAFRQMLESEEE